MVIINQKVSLPISLKKEIDKDTFWLIPSCLKKDKSLIKI